jgi:hypothetical protein
MRLGGIGHWRVGRGQEDLSHTRDMPQNSALDARIELGQRIVQQEDRRAADSFCDGRCLREA